mmetsp:Transcript_37563/g.49809  ORF Transcript_37563/g.49809 Transcript_37563/m.49809 type:complete len:86 (-) Transcript_37563:611-868(-)
MHIWHILPWEMDFPHHIKALRKLDGTEKCSLPEHNRFIPEKLTCHCVTLWGLCSPFIDFAIHLCCHTSGDAKKDNISNRVNDAND